MPQTKHGDYTGGWFAERNVKRKERYHSDATYRERANRDAREGYRRVAKTNMPFDPRTNLGTYVSMGKLRTVENGGDEVQLTYTKRELAAVLGRPLKQIQQWSADGRIPATVTRAKAEGWERNWLDVYTPAEVRAILDALGEFLSYMIYFRKDHVDAIRAVHDAVDAVRG